MPTVTAIFVVLAFLAGCVTAVVGFRVGHGESSLPTLLDWAAVTLVLQLCAACIAVVHARAARGGVADTEPSNLDHAAVRAGHLPGARD